MEMMRMRCSRLLTVFQRSAALLLAAALVPVGWAQAQDTSPVPSAPSTQRTGVSSTQPFDVEEYSKPRSHFPNPVGPYPPRHVEQPNLANTTRIDELMRDGKLYISMNDAV